MLLGAQGLDLDAYVYYHVYMLNKRVTILFSEEQWKQLSKIAASQDASVGALVRGAVEETFRRQQELAQIRDAVDSIRKMRPAPSKQKIDYKAMINYGRKY